jgi:hypothetical protein
MFMQSRTAEAMASEQAQCGGRVRRACIILIGLVGSQVVGAQLFELKGITVGKFATLEEIQWQLRDQVR